jgi:hypothetical protein
MTIGVFYPAFGGESSSFNVLNLRAHAVSDLPTVLDPHFRMVLRSSRPSIWRSFCGHRCWRSHIPNLVSSMLSKFGYRATMISLGIEFLILGEISLLPIKRRIPYTRGGARRHGRDSRFSGQSKYLLSKPMLVGAMVIFLTGLGNFIPSLWIPGRSLPYDVTELVLTH